jgi:TonB family protein
MTHWKNYHLLLAVTLATFLFSACSTRQFFTNVSPAPDSTVEDSIVVVKFRTAERLDLRSFNSSSLLLSGSKTGPVTVRVRADSTTNEVALTILDSLFRDERLDVALTDKLRTLSGENIPDGMHWGFWVSYAPWQYPFNASDSVFFVMVDELPEPIGGIAAIQRNVVYPDNAKTSGIQGTVYVEAFLDETGTVTRTNVVKGIGGGCDEAAMNAIRMTQFTPGKQKGKPVKVRMSIPIRFRLQK